MFPFASVAFNVKLNEPDTMGVPEIRNVCGPVWVNASPAGMDADNWLSTTVTGGAMELTKNVAENG
jgi:hypothetical protein